MNKPETLTVEISEDIVRDFIANRRRIIRESDDEKDADLRYAERLAKKQYPFKSCHAYYDYDKHRYIVKGVLW